MKKYKLTSFFLSVLLFSSLFITSCKDKSPINGIILVTYENGSPVSGANVVVSCTGDPDKPCSVTKATKKNATIVPYVEGTTDAEGKIKFEFDLPSVLKVDASFATTEDSAGISVARAYTGEGFIKLEEHKDTDQTIIVYQ